MTAWRPRVNTSKEPSVRSLHTCDIHIFMHESSTENYTRNPRKTRAITFDINCGIKTKCETIKETDNAIRKRNQGNNTININVIIMLISIITNNNNNDVSHHLRP